jgi:hypothetical protein
MHLASFRLSTQRHPHPSLILLSRRKRSSTYDELRGELDQLDRDRPLSVRPVYLQGAFSYSASSSCYILDASKVFQLLFDVENGRSRLLILCLPAISKE